ncbi:MAG TPA: hypothetical protein DIV86_05490 [Alphaproteobacteria bacterium]|nr:hypothetical protein [Alphaproteobacteria bacterium]
MTSGEEIQWQSIFYINLYMQIHEAQKNLIIEHRRILGKARKIIEYMLDKMEEDLTQLESEASKLIENDSKIEDVAKTLSRKFLWGEKESAVSIMNKVVQLLLKLVPVEIAVTEIDLDNVSKEDLNNTYDKKKLSRKDMLIMQRYIDRHMADEDLEEGEDNEDIEEFQLE